MYQILKGREGLVLFGRYQQALKGLNSNYYYYYFITYQLNFCVSYFIVH